MRSSTATRRPNGFALIEALVSMLVLAGGMLGIAGFEINLSRNADVAKQRTEATRLAQDKMEELRSFEQLAKATGKVAYADLAGANDTPTTTSNAVFSRNWAVGGAATDNKRLITVSVSWTDRAGTPQVVTLNSMISAANPADIGRLAVTPAFLSGLYRPKDRSPDVPIAAVTIGTTGKSTIAWTGASGGHLLFNNTAGGIVAKCTTAPTTSNTTATTNHSSCTTVAAFLLSGYIHGQLPTTTSQPPVVIDQMANIVGTPECVTRVATDQNDGGTISAYRAYTCLITPSTANTPRRWTGRARLVGANGSNLVSGDKVCRYSNDNNGNGTIDPVEHPERYVDVVSSIDNQNFYLPSTGGCPAGTVLHQTISTANGGTGL